MPPVGFEPAISVDERPQAYALDRAATGTGKSYYLCHLKCKEYSRIMVLELRVVLLIFRHRASCILGQAFRYSPDNAFYIFNQQVYFII